MEAVILRAFDKHQETKNSSKSIVLTPPRGPVPVPATELLFMRYFESCYNNFTPQRTYNNYHPSLIYNEARASLHKQDDEYTPS